MQYPALHVAERLNAILLNLLALIMQQVPILRTYTLPLHARITRRHIAAVE